MGKHLELYISDPRQGASVLIEVEGVRRTERQASRTGASDGEILQSAALAILESEDGFEPRLRIIDPTRTQCKSGEMTISLEQMRHWRNGGGAAPRLGGHFHAPSTSRSDDVRRDMGMIG